MQLKKVLIGRSDYKKNSIKDAQYYKFLACHMSMAKGLVASSKSQLFLYPK